MKAFTIAACLLLLPFIAQAQDSARAAASVPDTVVVATVTSGTTFTTDDSRTITLLGISVPTSKAITAADAHKHLADMIEGDTVVLAVDSLAPADTKKAKLRHVFNGSTLINLQMLRDGYASVSKAAHSLADTFRQANDEAKSAHKGAYASERSESVQCSATTKKGTRCSRLTTNLSGRCWQHE